MNLHNIKLEKMLSCPNCKLSRLKLGRQYIKCEKCNELYSLIDGVPVLIKSDSPVWKWYDPCKETKEATKNGYINILRYIYRWLHPDVRVWTGKSKKALKWVLEISQPDAFESNVVLIGTGFETVYSRILKPYKNIMRVGLASRGAVDLVCDICNFPLRDASLDLIVSSSVLEHVYDPERAVKEMARIVKGGGYVYAEIPFLRAYHMAPVDYQRYTISGIEELFKRHGFTLIKKGICSGPFTALVLFWIDFCGSLLSFNKHLRSLVVLMFSITLHPIKYLDRLFENSLWAEVNACNFYYIGRKK